MKHYNKTASVFTCHLVLTRPYELLLVFDEYIIYFQILYYKQHINIIHPLFSVPAYNCCASRMHVCTRVR